MTRSAHAEEIMDDPADDESKENEKFLTFILSGDRYGIPLLDTKEIIEYQDLTTVPMVPIYIAGVINLRGSVVPVVNLAERFQLPQSTITKKTSVVIVEINDEDSCVDIGIMVDMVNEVIDLKNDQIAPPPSFGTSIRADFIKNMGKSENSDGFLIILDASKVLSLDELSALEEIKHSHNVSQ